MAYSTISKPSLHFNTKLYTGDGTSPRSITGVGFQPDFLWIKNRTGANGYEHRLMDAVRGSNKVLHTSTNGAESSEEYYTVSSFDSDGWTGRNGTGTNQVITGGNDNGYTFASWNWKANGADSANTDGSINSTVSVNQTAGFSIVSYTGTGANATVGHGLGSVPKVVIVKTRSGTGNWINYHSNVGNTKYLSLNQTNSAGTTNQAWNDTSPTSSVFSLGNSSEVNGSGTTMIAYCFADVKGYSKFGSYVGNASTNGTFIYTGFKPAMVILKDSTSVSNWMIYDNKREGYNVDNDHLKINTSDAEGNSDDLDILSNGFKLRTSGNGENKANATFIYMAFAEEPLVANVGASIPATAR